MRSTGDAAGRRRGSLIEGDDLGPECSGAVRRILDVACAPSACELPAAGAPVFRAGLPSDVPPDAVASMRSTRAALKGPLETLLGNSQQSGDVMLRKHFATDANARSARELPGVTTPSSGRGIDLVVVREDVEDAYAGCEHLLAKGGARSRCVQLKRLDHDDDAPACPRVQGER